MDWGVTQGTPAYPDLAESWEVSDDGLTYTFHLREGVTWHDGAPFTSADVKYTYDTIIQNEYPLYNAVLRNATAVNAPDDSTLVIELAAPDLSFVPTLANNSIWFGKIVPSHLYIGTAWEEDWNLRPVDETPIGTGPFKFVSWEQGASVVLEANDDYFLGRPQIDTLIFQRIADKNVATSMFYAGETPYLVSQHVPGYGDIAAMVADPEQSAMVVKTPSIFSRNIYINLSNEILQNLTVRQAIAKAIDREQISQLAFLGLWDPVQTAGVQSLGDFFNPDARYPDYNPEEAEALLDEAGYPRGADGTRFALRLMHPPIADTALISEVLVQQLEDVGIDVDWQQPDFATWQEALENGNYDLTIYYTRFGPDPNSFWEHFATEGQVNFTGYSNPEVDDLLERGKSENDLEERVALYHEVQEHLVADIPEIALFQQTRFSLVNPEWSGFPVQESGFNKSMTWFGMYAVVPPVP
jgi:peptide/nickel transport system substrate-binding protein